MDPPTEARHVAEPFLCGSLAKFKVNNAVAVHFVRPVALQQVAGVAKRATGSVLAPASDEDLSESFNHNMLDQSRGL